MTSGIWVVSFGTECVVLPLGTFARVDAGGIVTLVSIFSPPARHRVRARMGFREWSQAVDRDGLRSVRSWLRSVELALVR
jgi:hypothetical protein